MSPRTKNNIVGFTHSGLLAIVIWVYIIEKASADWLLVVLIIAITTLMTLRSHYGKHEVWRQLCGSDYPHCAYDKEF